MTDKISFRWGIPLLDGKWTQFPNHFFRVYHQIVSKEEWMFICHLATYKYESEQAECRPSHATIAQEMGYKNRQSVQKLQRTLVEKGYLKIIPRKGKPNLYDFTALSHKLLVLDLHTPVGSIPQYATPANHSMHLPANHSMHEEEEDNKKKLKRNTAASGGDAAADNGHPLYQIVDVADLVDAAPDVPHTELTASCENCGAIMERDADCPDCGTPTFWKLGRLTGRQRDAIKKLEKPNLLVAPGDELGRRAARLWSDGVYWRSASQRATFLKLKKVKPRGWFLQILKWAEETRGITFSSFKKALNNPVQYQKWEDRQQSKPDAEGYAENRQAQDDAALAEAQAEASQVEPVDLEAMGIVTR